MGCPGGYQCGRCYVPISASMKKKFEKAECPGWVLIGDDGEVPGSGYWSACAAGTLVGWKRAMGGPDKQTSTLAVRVEHAATGAARRVGGKRLAPFFREHKVVAGAGLRVCLVCGCDAGPKSAALRRSCEGTGRMRPGALRVLMEGGFDPAIARLGPRAEAWAEFWGRRVSLGARPREPD